MPKRKRKDQNANFARYLPLFLDFLDWLTVDHTLFNTLCLVSKYVHSQRSTFISKFKFRLNRDGLSYWARQESKIQPRNVFVCDITQEDVTLLEAINPHSLECVYNLRDEYDFSRLGNVTSLMMTSKDIRLPPKLPPNLKMLIARCRELPRSIPTLECLDYSLSNPLLWTTFNENIVYPNLKCVRIVNYLEMPNLAKSKKLECVSLLENFGTPFQIRYDFLYQLTKLKVLCIAAAPKSDFFLNLPLLKIVQISIEFRDADLSCFKNCPNLKVLEIRSDSLIDVSLVSTMPKLQFCNFPKTTRMGYTTRRFLTKLRRPLEYVFLPKNDEVWSTDKFDVMFESKSNTCILTEKDIARLSKSSHLQALAKLRANSFL